MTLVSKETCERIYDYEDCPWEYLNHKNIKIEDGTKFLSIGAFEYCDEIETVELPESLTKLKNSAFYHCTNLKSIKIPNSVSCLDGPAIFDGHVEEFDEDLLKLSDNLKYLSETSDLNEPIPLFNCDEEVFYVFKKWFNELKKVGIVRIPNEAKLPDGAFTFKYKMFEDYDIDFLYRLLDFAFRNQIFLLFETLTYVFAKKIKNKKFIVKQIDSTHYILNDKLEIPHFYIKVINDKLKGKHKIFDVEKINKLKEQIKDLEKRIDELDEDPVQKDLLEALGNSNYVITNLDSERYKLMETLNNLYGELNEAKNFIATYEYSPLNVKNLLENSESVEIIPGTIKSFTLLDYGMRYNKMHSFIIPNSVKSLGCMAFTECKNLKEITIPESITYISDRSFERAGLTSISIPSTITSINECCFNQCKDLKTVEIPNSVIHIYKNAFSHCTSLKNIVLPSVKYIGLCAFEDCRDLTITIPGCCDINQKAFDDCENLTIRTFKNQIRVLQKRFPHVKFEDINPDNDETTIKAYTFLNNFNIRSLTINEGITKIEANAFINCINLSEVILPSTLKEIEKDAFVNCEKIKMIN